jgi:hypothetical protein
MLEYLQQGWPTKVNGAVFLLQLAVYPNASGIFTPRMGNLPRKWVVLPWSWYIYQFIGSLPRPCRDIYHIMGWPTNMCWALYPSYWAANPIDWKFTQVHWAYSPLVWVISQGKWADLPPLPGTYTNSLAVCGRQPRHTGRSTIAWDDVPTWVGHCTHYIGQPIPLIGSLPKYIGHTYP